MAYTTIDNPELYFQCKLWTGDDSNKSFTLDGDENMQPDFIWSKVRNYGGQDYFTHQLADSVRGTGKTLWSSETDAEQSNYAYGYVSAFNSDGFSVTAGSSSVDAYNGTGRNYVAWNWLAGGSASSNSDGSITSSVSANTTAGFSIVTYTGTGSGATNNQTVGHGLGVTPNVVIFKRRDNTGAWLTYHESLGINNYVYLNTTDASASASGIFSGYTSSVFKFSVNANDQNASGGTHVAYCFAEKQGYSKFGKYTGNGNADGPFVYTGFKPAWVLVKKTSEAREWMIWDNKRDSFNVSKAVLHPDNNAAEDSSTSYEMIDILSNGFKLRQSDTDTNQSGGTYIFMAFAESPFVNSAGAVPNNAR